MENTFDFFFFFFLVNHTKSHRISFIKQKYLTEITGTLMNLFINNSITNCCWQKCCQIIGKWGLEKPWLCSCFNCIYVVQVSNCDRLKLDQATTITSEKIIWVQSVTRTWSTQIVYLTVNYCQTVQFAKALKFYTQTKWDISGIKYSCFCSTVDICINFCVTTWSIWNVWEE